MKTISTLIASAILGLGAAANAQGTAQHTPSTVVLTPPVYGYSHAATAAESYARGQAALIQAQATYLYLGTMARINAAEANRRDLENRVQATKTYFAVREINRANTHPDRSMQYAKERAPNSTRVSQKNAEAGKVTVVGLHSPKALSATKYYTFRTLAEKALSGATLTAEERETLVKDRPRVLASLKAEMRSMSPADYVDAKRFVEQVTKANKSTNG